MKKILFILFFLTGFANAQNVMVNSTTMVDSSAYVFAYPGVKWYAGDWKTKFTEYVRKNDTTSILTSYVKKSLLNDYVKKIDTLNFAQRISLNQYLKYIDTADMLLPYVKHSQVVNQVNSDWNSSSGLSQILNKPTIPSNTNELTNGAGFISTELDPTVPSYSKSLTGFSIIKNAADTLYKPISYHPSWGQVTGKPSFSNVSTSGSYNDLIDKPTIPSAQVQSDWNATSGIGVILNKPTIPTNTNQLTNGAGFLTSFTEVDPTVPSFAKSLTTFSVIKSSTDPLYRPISYVPSWSEITSKPTFSTVATSGSYNDLSNKPTIPTLKRQEAYSGSTSGSGTYTVTFGNSYSVAPNIQITCTNCSDIQRVRVTSITTTGFTIQGRSEALGLIFTNANGLTVDVLVTEK